MLQTDADLPTLIKRKDHLNVLRYIRIHQLREPALVVAHGKAWLGPKLKTSKESMARLAALEQICLAALDLKDFETSEVCLDELRKSQIPKESTRFRLLLARCLEASSDMEKAGLIYDGLIQENPCNLQALKRKYCLLKAVVGQEMAAMEALNKYLEQSPTDVAAWYELADMRKNMGDFKGAAFCLEEVLLSVPSDATIHVELAECYATSASAFSSSSSSTAANSSLERLGLARKHMAQALEFDSTNRRAQFGLVTVANAYLEELAKTKRKDETDAFEGQVATELLKYGAEQLLACYKGTPLFPAVKSLMTEYTESN